MASREGERRGEARVEVRRDRVRVERTRGVFMISVAAELAEMHPQTLRMYEARGLIQPQRSAKNTRLYSQADVERLRKIQRLTSEEGLNLAGVESVLELEARLEGMRAEMEQLREQAAEMERRMAEEVERVRRSLRAEIVPYRPEANQIMPRQPQSVKIEVERPARKRNPRGDAS
jgi:MerR family transcriptional regulator/heat shock protein HspR